MVEEDKETANSCGLDEEWFLKVYYPESEETTTPTTMTTSETVI